MINLRRPLLITLVLLLSPAVHSDSNTEIRSALDYYAEVWNEGDFASLGSYYHKDFVLISSKGLQTLEQRLSEINVIMERGKDHGKLEFLDVTVKPLEKEHAVAYGSSRVLFKDGTELSGVFSTIYVKTPFGWKAILTHE